VHCEDHEAPEIIKVPAADNRGHEDYEEFQAKHAGDQAKYLEIDRKGLFEEGSEE